MAKPGDVVVVTERQLQAIQLMILWRFDTVRGLAQIADIVGVSRQTIHKWRKQEAFLAEYQRQLDLYKNDFADIKLSDRKERVKAMSVLYENLPHTRTELKLKILKEIRAEVGDNHPVVLDVRGGVQHDHSGRVIHSAEQGPNLPPRAETYDEWVAQNNSMALPAQDGETPKTEPKPEK